jgi:hypothetical protein
LATVVEVASISTTTMMDIVRKEIEVGERKKMMWR